MKSGQSYPNNRPRRPRRAAHNNNRRHNGGGHQNPNKHWESLGPNVRIRGSATQIYDKYIGLSEDAKRNGDRVLVENLKQHAEHYLRLVNIQQAQKQERQERYERQQAQAEQRAEEATQETGDDEPEENTGAEVEDLTPKAVPVSPDTDDADEQAMG